MTAPQARRSDLGQAAERYAAAGWRVFPLVPRDKQPVTRHGYLESSADPEQVRAWWRATPNANIGLYPGGSGLAVIDLDGPQGEADAAALGILSEPTLECQTGRPDGGRHLYFRHPGGHIPNGKLAPKIDVRADAGYVVLPPSVHPTGAVYRWQGKVADLRDCPDALAVALRAMGTTQMRDIAAKAGIVSDIGGHARDIPTLEEIAEGGRDNTLARYAGRLLAKGLEVPEVLALVSALNADKCKPPLPGSDVVRIVASIATKESRRQRTTSTGVTLSAVGVLEESEAVTPAGLASVQTAAARQLLTRDLTLAPRWAWSDLNKLVGPMLPGEFVVVGALMGNGKSTLFLSQMDAWAAQQVPLLYLPLEVDPEVCRLRWAAWRLSLDVRHVIRQDWRELPDGARESVDECLDELEANPFVHFAPDKRVTVASLAKWCRWGVDEIGARVVLIDHFHRMDIGADANFRIASTEAARQCKDIARTNSIVVLAAAQLNRNSDAMDPYLPPGVGRIKETAGLAEEADALLMLSRRVRLTTTDADIKELRAGRLSEAQLADTGVMVVTCRKHRLDDSARDRCVTLLVHNNRVVSHAWSHA